jgi:hypothetical protein
VTELAEVLSKPCRGPFPEPVEGTAPELDLTLPSPKALGEGLQEKVRFGGNLAFFPFLFEEKVTKHVLSILS